MDYAAARKLMVGRHLKARGISDQRVIEVMARLPREDFIWDVDRDKAYADSPLRIGSGQTISQPYMAALMTEELGLTGNEKVLEIGTGSGYQTALLAELAREVHSIERIEELTVRADAVIEQLGYLNVTLHVGDGTLGLPEEAPFDRILVTAGAPEVPIPLRAQLAEGGRMVIPVGPSTGQELNVIDRRGGRLDTRHGTPCIFVRLKGEKGWPED